MITVKSNIDKFLKNYRKKVEARKSVLNGIAEKLAKKMSNDMKDIIKREMYVWSPDADNNDETGKMAYHRSKIDNMFSIESLGYNSVRVSIGDNLQKHDMGDGNLVNPAYFIEFGFGLRGQANPANNHEKYGWKYNLNSHNDAWYYEGWDGEFHISDGTVGTNFMYNTIQEYRNNWKKYLNELMAEAKND